MPFLQCSCIGILLNFVKKAHCVCWPELSLEIIFASINLFKKKVQVGKDQEKAQSEKDSHSKNRGGEKEN